MAALFAVHNELGSTMLEKHYQRALSKELKHQGVSFQQEVPVELSYKGESIGKYVLDFIVEDKIIIEIKAQKAYDQKFFKQALAYLRTTNLPLAILVNFQADRLEYKRIVNYSH
jgi:GxxExxY protein